MRCINIIIFDGTESFCWCAVERNATQRNALQRTATQRKCASRRKLAQAGANWQKMRKPAQIGPKCASRRKIGAQIAQAGAKLAHFSRAPKTPHVADVAAICSSSNEVPSSVGYRAKD
jgi:hypothetical protein